MSALRRKPFVRTSKQIVQLALSLVAPQFRLDINRGYHGVSHWARVLVNAEILCAAMKLDPTVPRWFAFIHDSQRFDENIDIDHGDRAAEFVDEIADRTQLDSFDLHLLKLACRGHSHGETLAHPIVQVCWDADRLDLGRVQIRPEPNYLCTSPAKRPDVIEAAFRRSTGEKSLRV